MLPKAEVSCSLVLHPARWLNEPQTPQGQLLNNFVSGSVGGFVGTVINTPYVAGRSLLRVEVLTQCYLPRLDLTSAPNLCGLRDNLNSSSFCRLSSLASRAQKKFLVLSRNTIGHTLRMFPDPEYLVLHHLTFTQTYNYFPRRGPSCAVQGFCTQGTKAGTRWRCVVARG